MNRISFINRGYAFKGLLAVIHVLFYFQVKIQQCGHESMVIEVF